MYYNLGEYTVPEGTPVALFHDNILRNKDYWVDPDVFKPERFLDSRGQYLTARPAAFIPFGVGRRVCLGERLAIADLFLVLVRFLQSTRDYDILLDSHNGIDPDPNITDAYNPYEYKIIFKTKSH